MHRNRERILIFPNEDAEQFSLNAYNLPTGFAVLEYNIVSKDKRKFLNQVQHFKTK